MRYREPLTVPVTLDRGSGTPLHTQLAAQLAAAISRGGLAPGTRLPSTRTLAALLQISRGVAEAGYQALVASGAAHGHGGSGTYVAGRSTPARSAGAPTSGLGAGAWPSGAEVDLRPGAVSAEIFPLAAWRAAWRQASCRIPSVQRLPPLGLPVLRAAVAEHLRRTRGLSLHDHELVVTGGAAAGLRLVLRAMAGSPLEACPLEASPLEASPLEASPLEACPLEASPVAGSPVAVQEHAPAQWPGAVRAAGQRPVSLAVDGQGPRVPAGCPTAVLSTDGHVGCATIMTAGRRVAVAGWAARSGATVVELACDQVLRPAATRLPRLLDLAPGHTVLVGGFCQTLTPTLRLGYAVVPRALAPAVAELIASHDEQPPYVLQRAVAQLLDDGTIGRLTHRRTLLLRHKRELAEQLLRPLAPLVRIGGLDAAGTAMLRLPHGQAAAVADALRGMGLHLAAAPPAALLLGYGQLPDDELRWALNTLVTALRQVLAGARRPLAA